tara:strand:- start:306 stop:851 length:546 start_codon:yes stop_codon:yes gene_type:complete
MKECNLNLSPLMNHIIKTNQKDKGKKRSNYGGWQSKNFTKPNSYTKILFSLLDTAVKEIKNKIDYQHNLKLQDYWYNINYQDSFNIPHTHVGVHTDTIVSGVFYIETPQNCGSIIFKRNDLLGALMYSKQRVYKYNKYNSSVWEVNPIKNLCVLFPAHLEHFVEPNLNKERRISISFNYGL